MSSLDKDGQKADLLIVPYGIETVSENLFLISHVLF